MSLGTIRNWFGGTASPQDRAAPANDGWEVVENAGESYSVSPWEDGAGSPHEEGLSFSLHSCEEESQPVEASLAAAALKAEAGSPATLKKEALGKIREAFLSAIRRAHSPKTWTISGQWDHELVAQILRDLTTAGLTPALRASAQEGHLEVTITAPGMLLGRPFAVAEKAQLIGADILSELQIMEWTDKVLRHIEAAPKASQWQGRCLLLPQPIHIRVLKAFAAHMRETHQLDIRYYQKESEGIKTAFYSDGNLKNLNSKKKLYFQAMKI